MDSRTFSDFFLNVFPVQFSRCAALNASRSAEWRVESEEWRLFCSPALPSSSPRGLAFAFAPTNPQNDTDERLSRFVRYINWSYGLFDFRLPSPAIFACFVAGFCGLSPSGPLSVPFISTLHSSLPTLPSIDLWILNSALRFRYRFRGRFVHCSLERR